MAKAALAPNFPIRTSTSCGLPFKNPAGMQVTPARMREKPVSGFRPHTSVGFQIGFVAMIVEMFVIKIIDLLAKPQQCSLETRP